MNNCIFCKIVRKEIPSEVLYEDEDFIAILDIQPNNFGHSLVMPKEHYENIYSMPDDLLTKLGPALKKVSVGVKAAVDAEGINVIMNNDRAAGQIVMHQHTHIIPRYTNDGNQWWPHKEYPSEEKKREVADKIRVRL